MTNNQKILLYTAITAVVLFVGYKLLKKPNANVVDDRPRKPDGTLVEEIPQSLIDQGLAKANERLQTKKAKYEALGKKSGSKLSFKEWYIENAD